MPKLDLDAIPQINLTGYPSPWREEMAKRHYRRLGPASGLGDFGVSHVTLEPGGVSSQRHWHEDEDEFVVMLEGEAVLEEEGGETVMRAGRLRHLPEGRRQRPSAGQPRRRALRLHRDRQARARATATIPTSTCISTAPPAASPARTARLIEGHSGDGHQTVTQTVAGHSAAWVSYFSITQGSSCAASTHSRSQGWESIASI